MNTTIVISAIMSIATSLFAGILLYKFQKSQRQIEERAETRRRESMLGLEMAEANAKLSYACAMALKRGHANGEVEEAVKAYEKSRKNYYKFLDEQAYQNIIK